MVWCGDDDRVELLADLVEHPPVIREYLDLRRVPVVFLQIPQHLGLRLFVRVHDGYDIVLGLRDDPIQMAHGSAPAADMRAIELIAGPGRRPAQIGPNRRQAGKNPCGQCCALQEVTTSE